MKKIIIPLFILVVLFCCCKRDVSESLALKVGNLEITTYEFERNRVREMMANSNDSSILDNSKMVAQWKNDYLDRCYIINDAYEKRYDTISLLATQIKAMGDYMMCSRYGYLWKATISPIVDEARKITPDKVEKRKKLYYFDGIFCEDIQKLTDITEGGSAISSKEDFLQFKSKVSNDSSFSCHYISEQWPFLSFWNSKEYLHNLKAGEVSKLLHQDGRYFYLYLDHIEEVPSSQQDLESMSAGIQYRTEDELIVEMDSLINATCEPKLNMDNILRLSSFLEKGNKITDFDEDLELVTYRIDGDMRSLSCKSFMKYYTQQPMAGNINDNKALIGYIESYYKDEYLINEANKLDLYHSDVFVLDQKNYQNNLFYSKYIADEITSKIEIDSLAVEKYYNENPSLFKQPKSIGVKLYSFKNRESALMGLNKISQLISMKEIDKTKDKTIIEGLMDFYQTNIDMESSVLPIQTKSVLLNTNIGSLTQMPVQYGDNYVLFYKETEDGESVLELAEVYSTIEQNIKSQRIEEEKKKLVAELKGKYELEIDNTGI